MWTEESRDSTSENNVGVLRHVLLSLFMLQECQRCEAHYAMQLLQRQSWAEWKFQKVADAGT